MSMEEDESSRRQTELFKTNINYKITAKISQSIKVEEQRQATTHVPEYGQSTEITMRKLHDMMWILTCCEFVLICS